MRADQAVVDLHLVVVPLVHAHDEPARPLDLGPDADADVGMLLTAPDEGRQTRVHDVHDVHADLTDLTDLICLICGV